MEFETTNGCIFPARVHAARFIMSTGQNIFDNFSYNCYTNKGKIREDKIYNE